MRGDSNSTIVRLGKVSRSDTSSTVVLSRARKPVFVDEVKDVFIPLEIAPSTKQHLSARIISALLIPLILLQPFIRVYAADESVASSSDVTTQQVVDDFATTSPSIFSTIGDTVLGFFDSGSTSDETASSTFVIEGDTSAASSTDLVASSTLESDATSTDPFESEASTTLNIDLTASSSATTTDQTSDQDEASTTLETTAEPAIITPEEPSINIDELIAQKEEEMKIKLRKQVEEEYTRGCVSLDNVGYYCLKNDTPKFNGDLTPSSAVTDVTAEPGTDGNDKEIFATWKGEKIQLTSNDWDDSFPAKDLSGRSVVWQGMKDGRWQIFYASFASASPKIVQITQGSESNFNPRVEGDAVVWQSWVDNNWEVYLARPYKGPERDPKESLPRENLDVGADGSWEVVRVTTTPVHDMFPSISNDVVTWQRAEDNGWGIYAYSIATGVSTRISAEGTKSEHPRFALVWDEGDSSGGRRLMSYDLASGAREDLTQGAQQAPYQQPYKPAAPVSSNDQASLPSPVFTATSTMKTLGKGDGTGGEGGDGTDLEPLLPDDLASTTAIANTESTSTVVLSSTTPESGFITTLK